jgi:Domain of unknown function (DUF4304)
LVQDIHLLLISMTLRKETRLITDFVSDVAYRKSRAAQARFSGKPTGQESSREVYLAGCASIGAYLGDSFGFRYAKSGPHARRRSGDLTFEISFQSSQHNIAGEHVGLSVHSNVLSAKIKKWRELTPPLCSFDYVSGGQIGNLQTNCSWLDWELADPSNRDEAIRDAIKAIEELAFPYFSKFENLPSLFKVLIQEDLPGMDLNHVIEFLMCFTDQATARLAAVNFLKRHSHLVRMYQRDYDRYAERGRQFGGWVNYLVFASHEFGFGDLSARET